MAKKRLKRSKGKLIRWDLKCSNDGSVIKNCLLQTTNTDIRCDGFDTLYASERGNLNGEHLLELFNVTFRPSPRGMVIRGHLLIPIEKERKGRHFQGHRLPDGTRVKAVVCRYYATLAE